MQTYAAATGLEYGAANPYLEVRNSELLKTASPAEPGLANMLLRVGRNPAGIENANTRSFVEITIVLVYLQQFLLENFRLLGEMAPYLTLGFFLAGILHAYIPGKVVVRHLGRESILSAVKAAIIGVPMPLCSCGVVPTAMGLRKRGASRSAVVAFLISTPQTGLDSIAATYGFFGWLFAIFRPIAAFVSGIAGGIATLLLRKPTADEEWMRYHKHSDDALERASSRSFFLSLRDGMRFAFRDLLGDIALWLVIGIAVAAVISLAIPEGFFAGKIGPRLPQMLVMMAVGIPLYVCSTASIPIAAVLIGKGISAGAAFVFLMTGPATNAATMIIIGRVMGWRVLAMYLGSIALLALGFGIGLDAIVAGTGIVINPMMHEHAMLPGWVTWGAAGLLTFFVVLHFWETLERRFRRRTALAVTDNEMDLLIEGMTCSHCVRTVTGSLKSVPGVKAVTVTLATGLAHVEGENLDRETLAKAVESVGYKVRKREG